VGEQDAVLLVRIGGFSLLFIFVGAGLSLLPRALERFPTITLIQVASNIAMWGGAVLLIVFGYGLVQVMWWIATLTIIVCLLYAAWNRRLLPELTWRPTSRFGESKKIFSYSAYAFLAQATSMVTYHADRLLIAYFLGPAAVAFYAVAANLASKLLSVAAALTSFVFPRAITLASGSERGAIVALYLRASRFTLLAIFPIAMPVIWLAPEFLTLWLGKEFALHAAVLLQILTAAYCIAVMSVAASQVYNGLGNSRIGAAYAATGSLINLALCGLLIPRFGTTGATIAVLAGMLQAILYAGSLERHLGLGWFGGQRKLYLQLALAMVGQSLLLYLSRSGVNGWFSLVAIGGGAWIAFYLTWAVCGFLNNDDKAVLSRLTGKWVT
ncbi:MAG: oligosaccharide flippase family protein, partial [Pseudomonadota bacterium]|nr:oligosaccharide flippase family protein [Pseudomonadota bacterium]